MLFTFNLNVPQLFYFIHISLCKLLSPSLVLLCIWHNTWQPVDPKCICQPSLSFSHLHIFWEGTHLAQPGIRCQPWDHSHLARSWVLGGDFDWSILGQGLLWGTSFGREWTQVCQELHLCNHVTGGCVCTCADARETQRETDRQEETERQRQGMQYLITPNLRQRN